MITIHYKVGFKDEVKKFDSFTSAHDFLEQLESDQCSHCMDTGKVTIGEYDDISERDCPFHDIKEVNND